MIGKTMTTRFFVTCAPGHYGDRTAVLSAHVTIDAARKSARGVGYAVRRGTAKKGDMFLRSDEALHPPVLF